jgi:glycosyltransferase involved in cell wall biosynthesis
MLPPVRVLTVGNMYPPHHYGGYELVWAAAVAHLRARGHAVRVLTTDANTGAITPDGEEVFRELRWRLRDGAFEPISRRAQVALARHNHQVLERHLTAFAPDVVGWWSMGGLTLTLLETVRRRGLPAVAFVHDEWLDYGRWADGWLNMFRGRRTAIAPVAERLVGMPARVEFGGAANYLFVSEHARQHALGLGLGLPRTDVAHSGIHESFLDPAPEQPWGWRLLYVGRLDPRKGVDTAIDALASLPAETTLELIGGWDEREEARLRDRARELDLGERVRFSGQCDRARIAAAYGAADTTLFPVRWDEPWGLVPLESMARGRPVVATGRGGSGEYLRDGENCLLFEAGDATALAAAVTRLAEDAELRSRLRAGGLVTAPEHTEAQLDAAVEAALAAAAGANHAGAPRPRAGQLS